MGAVEIFFRANKNRGWLKPASKYLVPLVSDKKISESQEIYEAIKTHPLMQWQSPLSPEQAAKYTPEDLVYLQKENIICCLGQDSFENLRGSKSRRIRGLRDGTIVYQADYSFDSSLRRITPRPVASEENILLMGDSLTLGEGVQDQETTASLLSQFRKKSSIFNLGISGAGPNTTLYELSVDPEKRLKDIPQGKTFVIYSYMNNHLERLFCRSLCLRPENKWMLYQPYFRKIDSKIEWTGFFHTDRVLKNSLYSWINKSALLEFFNVVLPTHFTERHFEFFADVVLEMKNQAAQKFPNSEFVLALYPGYSLNYADKIIPAVTKKGIRILDYSEINLDAATGNKSKFPVDGHPSPVTHLVYAYLLNRDLH